MHASIEMHRRDGIISLKSPPGTREIVGSLVGEVPRHITALRRASRTRGPPTATRTSRPNTTPRLALAPSSAPELLYPSDSAAGRLTPAFPRSQRNLLRTAPRCHGNQRPLRLLSAHALRLCLALSAHARWFPPPQVWRTKRPLLLTCGEQFAESAFTSWLRPSRVVIVPPSREARALGE